MLPTTLWKLEVWNCGNFQKKQSKNRDAFDKNWNVSCHVVEYCHNSCSKCLPFARTHARRRPRHSSIALSMTRSDQCHAKHTENAVSVYNSFFVGNLLGFPAVKEFWKSVKNWQIYSHEFGVQFFGPPCMWARWGYHHGAIKLRGIGIPHDVNVITNKADRLAA